MNKSLLTSSALIALLVCAPVAMAQTQQKGTEEKAAPATPSAPAATEQKTEPKAASPGASQSAPNDGKSAPKTNAAQSEPKEKANKGTAQKEAEPKEKATKGAAQNNSEPKDKSAEKQNETKAKSAEKPSETKAKSSDASTEKNKQTGQSNAQSGKSTTQNTPQSGQGGNTGSDQTAGASTTNGNGARVQVSEQQRSTVHETLLKEKNLNRVGKVNISINIGTRVPRSIRLASIPASVITVVPEYRNYRYFVVDDDICIVEPNSYEIVDVIRINDGRSTVALVLSDDERSIILREVEVRNDRTLGLGALSVGADVPRNVQLQAFPDVVVQRVPKLKSFEFFTAEDRIAVVEPQTSKIRLVIEVRR